jgi:hypothetical protein
MVLLPNQRAFNKKVVTFVKKILIIYHTFPRGDLTFFHDN